MQTEMQLFPAEAGQAIISLSVPAAKATMVADAIRGMLTLAGHKVRRINSEGEEVVSADEVFLTLRPLWLFGGSVERWNGRSRNWRKNSAPRRTVFPLWKAASEVFP